MVVNYLHAAVKEPELTHEEWFKAIEFLTAGRSDVQRVAAGVHPAVGHSRGVDAGRRDQSAGARSGVDREHGAWGPSTCRTRPAIPHGTNICLDGKGDPTRSGRGRVLDHCWRRPVRGAVVDVWQTNDDGFYDVQQKGILPDWNLRGVFHSDKDGTYWFRSVKPPFYPIPDDGPAGQLLRAIGRHPNRAAHVHFIVQAPGYETVVTHIFTPDCQFLDEDAVFGAEEVADRGFQTCGRPRRGKAAARLLQSLLVSRVGFRAGAQVGSKGLEVKDCRQNNRS